MQNKKALSAESIKKHIVNKSLQNLDIIFYSETDSTNTRAKIHAENGGKSAVFIADSQTAGRGRKGRSFDSEGGVGIYISFLIFPKEKAENGVKITARAAVALARAISEITKIKPQIKWVNDIVHGGKKLAGILTEGKILEDGSFSYAICGMGINIYKRTFPKEIKDIAISIEDASGEISDRSMLAAKIIEEFFREIPEEEILKQYRELSCITGRNITVYRGNESFSAKALSINESYELIIERESGEREALYSGEVSIKGKPFIQ